MADTKKVVLPGLEKSFTKTNSNLKAIIDDALRDIPVTITNRAGAKVRVPATPGDGRTDALATGSSRPRAHGGNVPTPRERLPE